MFCRDHPHLTPALSDQGGEEEWSSVVCEICKKASKNRGSCNPPLRREIVLRQAGRAVHVSSVGLIRHRQAAAVGAEGEFKDTNVFVLVANLPRN